MNTENFCANVLLDLLFSLGVNYPLIRKMGYHFNKPIACIVQSQDQIAEVIQNLTSFFPPKQITANTQPKQCIKMLSTANSEFIFIHYSNHPNVKKTLQVAISAAQTGIVGEKICNTIPIVFFYSVIPEELKKDFFLIYLPDDLVPDNDYYDENLKMLIKPALNKYQVIMNFIENMENKSSIEGALKCAAYFLYPYFKDNFDTADKILSSLLELSEYLIHANEESQDSTGVSDFVITQLHNWIKNMIPSNIYYANSIPDFLDGEYMLYDANYLYLPEYTFNKIIEPLKQILSSPSIKETLKHDSILICGQGDTFTCKVTARNINGNVSRKGVLKFQLDMLNQLGEIPLLDLYGING